ncbi:MAG: ABC transporter substrate-binding protein [Campylobacterales bacterium]
MERIKKAVSSLPKVRVYYAQGHDGLLTECPTSTHVLAFHLAKAELVHQCQPSSPKGFERVTIEEVIKENPDVIFAQEKEFVKQVYSNPSWRSIAAVRNHHVYLIPNIPFNWVDRPPSFMRVLGAEWIARILYPHRFSGTIEASVAHFYRLFFQKELTPKQIHSILHR